MGTGLIEVGVSVGGVVSVGSSTGTGGTVVSSIVGTGLIMSLGGCAVAGVAGRSVVLGGVLSIIIMSLEVLMVSDLSVGVLCTVVVGSRLAGIGGGVVSTVGTVLATMSSGGIFG